MVKKSEGGLRCACFHRAAEGEEESEADRQAGRHAGSGGSVCLLRAQRLAVRGGLLVVAAGWAVVEALKESVGGRGACWWPATALIRSSAARTPAAAVRVFGGRSDTVREAAREPSALLRPFARLEREAAAAATALEDTSQAETVELEMDKTAQDGTGLGRRDETGTGDRRKEERTSGKVIVEPVQASSANDLVQVPAAPFNVARSRCVFCPAASPSRALAPPDCPHGARWPWATGWPSAGALCRSSDGRAPHHTSAWAPVLTEAVRKRLLKSSSQAKLGPTALSSKPQIASAYFHIYPIQYVSEEPAPAEALSYFDTFCVLTRPILPIVLWHTDRPIPARCCMQHDAMRRFCTGELK
ncbi:hypothetical protein CC78DRAFT_579159 [Lojkania enalia]|uniref:Uncharacterized protein n=1 Tax=Lojkania enalia TaxID=147567 RepID=A0A9P4N8N1_9PLEO|nr:hypothetical protein CC78DRAFT_579159 [Didymosphaeria enalia]